ncbi:MAG TPA: hypothetical protein VK917_09305 [Ilumatobacter sp.]|nr:hypothetical protein [Ilumatobacter sp.]
MVDFDVHGLAGVRVVGSVDDAAVVERQLGPLRGQLLRDPDIVVEFVDRMETGPLVFLGRDEWAFDPEGLLVLRGRRKSRIRARLPLDTIGEGCHILIERGAPAVPYLVALVNLCVLANGGLPLHAAAFEKNGVGVLVTGWSKGGKTESLLAALDDGARYVGDEWVYLSDEGERAVGVPEPIRVWDWYFDQLETVRPQLSTVDRARSRGLSGATAIAARAERGSFGPGGRQLGRRVRHLLDGQRYVDVPVSELTGSSARPRAITVDAVVHTMSTEASAISLQSTTGSEVAAHMAGSLAFERLPLIELYHAFRYAFPHRSSQLIERASLVERERLHDFLGPRRCWLSTHPYPPNLAELRRSLSPLWAGRDVAG